MSARLGRLCLSTRLWRNRGIVHPSLFGTCNLWANCAGVTTDKTTPRAATVRSVSAQALSAKDQQAHIPIEWLDATAMLFSVSGER